MSPDQPDFPRGCFKRGNMNTKRYYFIKTETVPEYKFLLGNDKISNDKTVLMVHAGSGSNIPSKKVFENCLLGPKSRKDESQDKKPNEKHVTIKSMDSDTDSISETQPHLQRMDNFTKRKDPNHPMLML